MSFPSCSLSSMMVPVTQGGKILVFFLCQMPHILHSHSILVIDLFIYISYYTVSPLRAGDGTFSCFLTRNKCGICHQNNGRVYFCWVTGPSQARVIMGVCGGEVVGNTPAGREKRALMTEHGTRNQNCFLNIHPYLKYSAIHVVYLLSFQAWRKNPKYWLASWL